MALSLNPSLRSDIVEVVNQLDKKNDLWASPLQSFLESLLVQFDSLDRLRLSVRRLPPQGGLSVLDVLVPKPGFDDSPFKAFCSWISLIKSSIRGS